VVQRLALVAQQVLVQLVWLLVLALSLASVWLPQLLLLLSLLQAAITARQLRSLLLQANVMFKGHLAVAFFISHSPAF
jgi:hypothetical protein